MSQENAKLLERTYAVIEDGDLEQLEASLAEDVVLHMPGESPIAGDHKGRDEIFGFLTQLFDRSAGSFKIELHDVLSGNDHVVGLHTVGAEREGKVLESREVLVAHVDDGKLSEIWIHPGDQYHVDAFWKSGPPGTMA